MEHRLEAFLETQEPDDTHTAYSDDMIADEACARPRKPMAANTADLLVTEIHEATIARDTVACELTAYTPDNKPTHLSTARYVDCDGKAHDVLILETLPYLVNVAYFDDDDSAQIVCAAYRELSVTDRVVDFTVKRMVMLQAMWKVMSSSSDSGKRWSEYGRRR